MDIYFFTLLLLLINDNIALKPLTSLNFNTNYFLLQKIKYWGNPHKRTFRLRVYFTLIIEYENIMHTTHPTGQYFVN